MSHGTVKEYNLDQGIGSIIDSESGQVLTVYANYITLKHGEFLHKGQEVEFEIEKKRHESWAINVRSG